MAGKQMEGNTEQRRAAAREAREHGKSASEVGASTGASQQRTKADGDATHQEKIDLKRQGKQDVIRENTPEARPGSRDADTLDRQQHPRLEKSDER
jgi:D-alanine-D-alanine ligase-like ATP-grasp enzyme